MYLVFSNKREDDIRTSFINKDLMFKENNGMFSIDEIINTIGYQRAFKGIIIDTSVVKDIDSFGDDLKKYKVNIDLDTYFYTEDETHYNTLVSLGYYNFAKNIDSLLYQLDNSRSYQDVVGYHVLTSENVTIPSPKDIDIKTKVVLLESLTHYVNVEKILYSFVNQMNNLGYKTEGTTFKENTLNLYDEKKLYELMESDFYRTLLSKNDVEYMFVNTTKSNNSTEYDNICHKKLYIIDDSKLEIMKLERIDFKELKGQTILVQDSRLSMDDLINLELKYKAKVVPLPFITDWKNTKDKELIKILEKILKIKSRKRFKIRE